MVSPPPFPSPSPSPLSLPFPSPPFPLPHHSSSPALSHPHHSSSPSLFHPLSLHTNQPTTNKRTNKRSPLHSVPLRSSLYTTGLPPTAAGRASLFGECVRAGRRGSGRRLVAVEGCTSPLRRWHYLCCGREETCFDGSAILLTAMRRMRPYSTVHKLPLLHATCYVLHAPFMLHTPCSIHAPSMLHATCYIPHCLPVIPFLSSPVHLSASVFSCLRFCVVGLLNDMASPSVTLPLQAMRQALSIATQNRVDNLANSLFSQGGKTSQTSPSISHRQLDETRRKEA